MSSVTIDLKQSEWGWNYTNKSKLQPLVAELSWAQKRTVVPQLPDPYRDALPSPEQIAERLRAWTEAGVRDGE